MRFDRITATIALAGLASAAAAQHSLVWITSSDHPSRSRANGFLSIANIDSSEMSIVTPDPGASFDSKPFLSTGASFLYVGYDGVGEWVDSATTGTWGISTLR